MQWTLMRNGTFDQEFCETWIYVAVLEGGKKVPIFSSKEEAEHVAACYYGRRRIPEHQRPEPRAIQFLLPAKIIRRSNGRVEVETFDWDSFVHQGSGVWTTL